MQSTVPQLSSSKNKLRVSRPIINHVHEPNILHVRQYTHRSIALEFRQLEAMWRPEMGVLQFARNGVVKFDVSTGKQDKPKSNAPS
jgi:hypothetical protein